eukprot:3885202-Pleurochrysis_carterae.AAC.3
MNHVLVAHDKDTKIVRLTLRAARAASVLQVQPQDYWIAAAPRMLDFLASCSQSVAAGREAPDRWRRWLTSFS